MPKKNFKAVAATIKNLVSPDLKQLNDLYNEGVTIYTELNERRAKIIEELSTKSELQPFLKNCISLEQLQVAALNYEEFSNEEHIQLMNKIENLNAIVTQSSSVFPELIPLRKVMMQLLNMDKKMKELTKEIKRKSENQSQRETATRKLGRTRR